MPDAPLTPEEKLLRIIEAPPGAARAMGPRRRLQDFKFSLEFFKTKYGPKAVEKARALLNLRSLNVLLVVLSVGATVFLVFDFLMGMPRSSVLDRIEASGKKIKAADLTIEGLEPLAIYTQEITQRNIFSLPEPPPAPAPAAQAPVPSPEATELTTNLKLVGIIWSDVPQAMLEDSKEQRTYLLNRGASIKGARVKDILKDRVILSYDNQDIEIR